MGHREILALTYPKCKMPSSAESGNPKRSAERRWCYWRRWPLGPPLRPPGMMLPKNCLAPAKPAGALLGPNLPDVRALLAGAPADGYTDQKSQEQRAERSFPRHVAQHAERHSRLLRCRYRRPCLTNRAFQRIDRFRRPRFWLEGRIQAVVDLRRQRNLIVHGFDLQCPRLQFRSRIATAAGGGALDAS